MNTTSKREKQLKLKEEWFHLQEFEDVEHGLMIDVWKDGNYIDEFKGSLDDEDLENKLTILLKVKYFK